LQAIVACIPRPNQAFWSLSALWSGWLFDTSAVQAMHSALERQHYDWHWHSLALHTLMRQISKFEPVQGFFAIEPELTAGYSLAALLGAQMGGWSANSLSFLAEENEMQVKWDLPAPMIGNQVGQPQVKQAILKLMQDQGEPLDYDQLFMCALAEMIRAGSLIPEVGRIPIDLLSTIQESLMNALSDSDFSCSLGREIWKVPVCGD